MGTQCGVGDLGLPGGELEGVEEFGMAEAGFDADAHVVAGDVVEAGEEVQ